ncbi:MAG: M48 family metalloprotease, partial [Candidatus Margulisiibacteriota bacterium]
MPSDQIRLYIIDDSFPNAKILKSSGDIYLHFGTLKLPGLTEGELAAVLAHEIGHYLKYSQETRLPKQFKNPLFREFHQKTLGVERQWEEYDADELALILLDAAGYSVNEAHSYHIKVEEILGSLISRSSVKYSPSEQKVYNPGSTHPETLDRIVRMAEAAKKRVFSWKNAANQSPVLFPNGISEKETWEASSRLDIGPDFLDDDLPQWLREADLSNLNLDWISQNLRLDNLPQTIIFRQMIQEGYARENYKDAATFGKLKAQAEAGDPVTQKYLQAAICVLFEEAAASKDKDALGGLKNKYDLSDRQIIFALLDLAQETCDIQNTYLTHLYEKDGKGFLTFPDEFPLGAHIDRKGLAFERVISLFPPSHLRDRLITRLLLARNLVKDRDHYVDTEYSRTKFKEPAPSSLLYDHQMWKIAHMCFGAKSVDFSFWIEHMNEDREFIRKSYDKLTGFDETENSVYLGDAFSSLFFQVYSGRPYDLSEISLAFENIFEYSDLMEEHFKSNLRDIAIRIYETTNSQEGPLKSMPTHVQDRIQRFGRITLSKIMETIGA